MCKCLQYYLESCYWHLIEKRFCYDESIALYEDPEREEKNNNFFDNLAFYDSVSVIAGRAIVTIDSLPEEKPIMKQPTRRFHFEVEEIEGLHRFKPIKDIPEITQTTEEAKPPKTEEQKSEENSETHPQPTDSPKPQLETLKVENLPDVTVRRKSLKDRRMSKSLYLKIDLPKELPIIRQQSMPKFYLDTPDDQNATSMFRTPSVALTSPVPSKSSFTYDLYSVVQMERERVANMEVKVHRKDSDRSSRLLLIRDKIKLRRVKSTLGASLTSLPHGHQHM